VRVALLGLGLIGGSIARALARAGTSWQTVAWSPTGSGPASAAAEGTVSAVDTPEEAVDGAGLVVLAAPPLACLELIDRVAGILGTHPDGPVVTDVASTKGVIVERARAAGLRFVGGHPMAGREEAGYRASAADLFAGRPWIVVPADTNDIEAQGRVEALATACGARPVVMTAADHDAAVAAISHLPLVLSAALVEAVASGAEWPRIRRLAAGGWDSMSRLARGDVEMGTGIIATNGPELVPRLAALRAVIDGWLADLGTEPDRAAARSSSQPDVERVRARLATARRLAGPHE
jgi:prephenate dehydrogenase